MSTIVCIPLLSIPKSARQTGNPNDLLNAALEEGNSNAEPILKIGEKEIEAIRNMSQDLKDNAINIVVERIVKIHGNS